MKEITKNIFKALVYGFIFITLVCGTNIFAQEDRIEFERISVEQGLSSNSIFGITQDKQGLLWIATADGLNRYDGYKFTVFRHDPSETKTISNNSVSVIYRDSSGVLWVGTLGGGLNKFDEGKEQFTRYEIDPSDIKGMSNSYIRSIYKDNSGNLWVGTEIGIFELDKEKNRFINFRKEQKYQEGLSEYYVGSICEDSSGLLWVGTRNGLYGFNKKKEQQFHYLQVQNNHSGLSHNWLNSICVDSLTLWIGTDAGLNRFNKEQKTFIKYFSETKINSIHKDKLGVVWVGTVSGLKKFSKEENKFINILDDQNIYSIFDDGNGILWIGTSNGLYKFDRRNERFNYSYSQFDNLETLNDQRIYSIYEDKTGVLWVGAENGLSKFDRKKNQYTIYQHNPKDKSTLSYNLISSIFEDREGVLWLGTFGNGLNKFDRNTGKFIHYLNNPNDSTSLSHNSVQFILEDKSGILWIGAYIGLNKFNKERKQFTRYYSSQTNHNKLSSNIILSITEDNSGYLWFATGYGLNKYEKGKNLFTSYVHDPNNPKSLSDNSVRSIYEDKKGTLWICTQGGGLNKFNRESGEFIHFRKKDGLPSDIAFDILEDEHNNLWISTSNGLTKFNSSKGLFRNYDTKDGLPSNEFSYRAKFKGSDGIIYFGTKKGLVAFHPDSIKDNPHIPPIVVTNFLLFNKSVPIGLDTTSDRMILEKSIINTKELELTYEDYIFSFEFAALDFHAPEKNKYAYMMEGFEKSWTYTDSKKRFATYTNLDPGEYTFRVIGSNNDGVWNEEGASIKLIITPPWWKTWWAYTFYILLGLSLLYSLRRYELNRTRYKHGLELKEVEAEKLRETDRMKSHFFANISHEFRTPLTLILGPADNIKSNSSTEDIQKQTGLIKRNANRLLNLVNQLLDLSKLEAGKLKVHASKGNIVSFVKGVAMSFESIAEKMDIQLRIKSSGDEVEMCFDKEMMIKILSNLLSNSFKFTHESGEITVNIKTTENDSLEIKIRDTGIGIASEELPKLFDRFYQVDASHTRKYEGTGIGLALTKELVELHHGSIKVESKKEEDEQNGWTEFIIELPLGKEHFAEDELVEEVISDSNLLPESKEYNPLDHSELEQSLSNLIHPEAFQLAPDEERMIILLVEDNSDVRDFIKDSLGNEFVVEEAFNGEHGVKKAENIIPDLIISDIMMPKMDGNELTRILKNDEKTSHIPIILLTAKSEQESKLEGLETGADDYLTKPFDTKELMIRIKNLINVRRKLQERYSRGDFIPAKKEPGKKLSYLDEQFMNKVMEVIEKHLSEEEFSIEQFGKEAGMSRVQLHRKLKALSGKSASTFLRSVRLSKAKKMIEEQKGNISEIAYSVGFSSPQYFTRCFKKEFGYPPSEVTI